jgi:hypothetical protein
MRELKRFDVNTAFKKWLARLDQAEVAGVPARSLYSGDHWSIVRGLENPSIHNRMKVNIWVCSAGYGLVSMDTLVKPYSATFSPSHPDSTSNWTNSDSNILNSRLWWQLLSSWTNSESGLPRSICDVAKVYPNSPIIVAASKVYLNAIADDLSDSLRYLNRPGLLSIVSTGTNSLDGRRLEANLLPSNASLQHFVGGALLSLNIRIVREIMGNSDLASLEYGSIKGWLDELIERQPTFGRQKRSSLTDDEVMKYILEQWEQDCTLARSPMLRRLRDRGLACEQSRFSSLYHSARNMICR